MQENLKKKYGITHEELKRAVDQIPFGKIACSGIVLVALCDLVCTGDIAYKEKIMTNRAHLNTLDNTDFAIKVLAKTAELKEKNFNPKADIFDIVNDTQFDFEDWLAEEYRGE